MLSRTVTAALAVAFLATVPLTAIATARAQDRPSDPDFGAPLTLTARTMVVQKGTANWDTAFETLVDALKGVKGYLDKEKIEAAGPPMTLYLSTDDTGFEFEAGYPIAAPPATAPAGDIAVTQSPAGEALKFVHRGSYDSMDSTYEAITNYLDEKQLDANDSFIEEYATDPLTTAEKDLVVNILVPVK